jgi:hypothetical protein
MQLKVTSNLEHTNQHANFKTEVFKIIKILQGKHFSFIIENGIQT